MSSWSFDSSTGALDRLMSRTVYASRARSVAVGLGQEGWRLRDLASGNEVALPVEVQAVPMIVLGENVVVHDPIPESTGHFPGAVFPLTSVPQALSRC